MPSPTKIDVTTPCLKCKGVMEIKMVEPSPENDGMMIHLFECEKCHSKATFPFPKKTGA